MSLNKYNQTIFVKNLLDGYHWMDSITAVEIQKDSRPSRNNSPPKWALKRFKWDSAEISINRFRCKILHRILPLYYYMPAVK